MNEVKKKDGIQEEVSLGNEEWNGVFEFFSSKGLPMFGGGTCAGCQGDCCASGCGSD